MDEEGGRTVQCSDVDDLTTCEVRATQDSINSLYLFITLSSLVLTVCVMFVVEALRARRRAQALKLLPSLLAEKVLPSALSDGGLGSGGDAVSSSIKSTKSGTVSSKSHKTKMGKKLSRRMQRVVRDAFEKSRRVLETLEPSKRDYADGSWGAPGSKYQDTHFQTRIAQSFRTLEEAARSHPELREIVLERSSKQQRAALSITVREFVEMLKERCEGIDVARCDRFVSFYETARFGDPHDCYTQTTYLEFIKLLYSLLLYFESGGSGPLAGEHTNAAADEEEPHGLL